MPNFEDMTDVEIIAYWVEFFEVWYEHDGIDGVTDWSAWFQGHAPDNPSTRYEILERKAGVENAKEVRERLIAKNVR